MPLTNDEAVDQARMLYGFHEAERAKLDVIRRYYRGCQSLPMVVKGDSPNEVKVMARSSRVNIMPIVVNTLVQSMFVDGFRAQREADDIEVWRAWQANRMDARQTGIHRATAIYGVAYATVLPGDTGVPVIKGHSPRSMCTMYGESEDWPLWALERLGRGLFRLFDDERFYFVQLGDGRDGRDSKFVSEGEHGMPETPVVRYLDEHDLDADDDVEPADGAGDREDAPPQGQVQPLMKLQDQIDQTTFALLLAQHYGAFKQRYIIGWAAESERDRLRAAASTVWTFGDRGGEEVRVGEFSQTNTEPFIRSREASLRHAATLSQTPVHELTGSLIQMSAEALAAAEAGKDRKVDERKTNTGESHEQTLQLCGYSMGVEVPDDAQVVWRDTSARSFAATVDGLGKLAQMLGVPVQELWEKIPGTTKQDVDRWKQMAQQGSDFDRLAAMLDRQSKPVDTTVV